MQNEHEEASNTHDIDMISFGISSEVSESIRIVLDQLRKQMKSKKLSRISYLTVYAVSVWKLPPNGIV